MNITVIPPVVETRTVEVAPAKVQLELSMEEASFIVALLGRVEYTVDDHRLYNKLYNNVIKPNPEFGETYNKLNDSMTGVISRRRN